MPNFQTLGSLWKVSQKDNQAKTAAGLFFVFPKPLPTQAGELGIAEGDCRVFLRVLNTAVKPKDLNHPCPFCFRSGWHLLGGLTAETVIAGLDEPSLGRSTTFFSRNNSFYALVTGRRSDSEEQPEDPQSRPSLDKRILSLGQNCNPSKRSQAKTQQIFMKLLAHHQLGPMKSWKEHRQSSAYHDSFSDRSKSQRRRKKSDLRYDHFSHNRCGIPGAGVCVCVSHDRNSDARQLDSYL